MKKVTTASGDYLVYFHPLTIMSNVFNELLVKSGWWKPNEQALVNQTYSINTFWLSLQYRKH